MNDTFPHDTSGGAASAITVRGRSGSTVGPSGSHYIIGPLQKASGPRKKEKTAMSHFWDTHHTVRGQHGSDTVQPHVWQPPPPPLTAPIRGITAPAETSHVAPLGATIASVPEHHSYSSSGLIRDASWRAVVQVHTS